MDAFSNCHIEGKTELVTILNIALDCNEIEGRKVKSGWYPSCIILSFFILVTYPLDITKTRLQIQGEHASVEKFGRTKYRGMVKTAAGIGLFILMLENAIYYIFSS